MSLFHDSLIRWVNSALGKQIPSLADLNDCLVLGLLIEQLEGAPDSLVPGLATATHRRFIVCSWYMPGFFQYALAQRSSNAESILSHLSTVLGISVETPPEGLYFFCERLFSALPYSTSALRRTGRRRPAVHPSRGHRRQSRAGHRGADVGHLRALLRGLAAETGPHCRRGDADSDRQRSPSGLGQRCNGTLPTRAGGQLR